MKTLFRLNTVTAALIAALALGACDDDNGGPTGTGEDTTPPTIASASGLDSTHMSVRFSEQVDRTSAETEGNYSIVESGIPTAAPGDPVPVLNASLMSDGRTVVLTTGDAMIVTGYTLSVTNVADMHGNAIEETAERLFIGSAAGDDTPPEIVLRDPTHSETNVPQNAAIEITFSEPVSPTVFTTAFTLSNSGGDVPVNVITTDDVHFVVQPVSPLTPNTLYTVSLIGVQDASSNVMQDAEWTFHTTTAGAVATSVR